MLASTGRPAASGSTRQQWERWGEATLRDGDILFLRGECLLFAGTFDFTWFSTTACDSLFSHIALVAREGDQLVAYDTSMHGPRRWQFGELMEHAAVDLVAVRRPIGAAQAAVPAALQFCRETVAADVEYDLKFSPEPNRLYCSELIAAAFRQGGVELSPPVRVGDLPGIDEINPVTLRVAGQLTSLQRDSPIWSLGNNRYGFWASPLLVEVLPSTAVARAPGPTTAQGQTH